MQRKENERVFKRRANNPERLQQMVHVGKKGTSSGKGRLRLEVDWKVGLRSWNFYCMVKRRHGRLLGFVLI